MAKGDFDYVRAWHELVRPAYDELLQATRDLSVRVARECGDCHQDAYLDTTWPFGNLRDAFEVVDSGDLALAARVVNSLGHWLPAGEVSPIANKHGGHWKFSNYCDQILRARCQLPQEHARGHELGFLVHEGLLRLYCDYPDGWTWQEVGIATPEFLDRCRAVKPKRVGDWPRGTHKQSQAMLDHYEAWLRAIKRLPDHGGAWIDKFLDLDAYKERGPEEVAVDEVLAGSGLRRRDICHVNFKPHPFTIGSRHLAHSPGMYLDPYSAPCAHPHCQLSYDEHTSDRVLFVTGAGGEDDKVELSDEQQTALRALAPVLEAHKIAGVAFLRPEAK